MPNNNPPPSALFTVRVWQETLSAEVIELRFQVTHVLSGETRVFREGNALLGYLTTIQADAQNERHDPVARSS
ncbi:MAG: hypothetical protein R3C14_20340 [Caldilineaceae bacterium]